MRPSLALVLTWAALTGCADAQSPPAVTVAEAVEIADGRRDDTGAPADAEAWAASAPFLQAVGAARSHWSRQDPGYEEEVRLLDLAEGAFTQAGAEQQAVLYLMGLWPRCCPKVGIAVVEDGRLVRNVAFEGSFQGLYAVPDLDGDGLDELVLDGTYGMGGSWTRSVNLAAFGPDGLVERGGTTISYDACAAGSSDGGEAAWVLATPGTPPTFTVERYVRASCEAEAWEPQGAPEPLVFEAPEESPYVELPVE